MAPDAPNLDVSSRRTAATKVATRRAAPCSSACLGQNSWHSHHHGIAFLLQQHFTKHLYFGILCNCTASLGRFRVLFCSMSNGSSSSSTQLQHSFFTDRLEHPLKCSDKGLHFNYHIRHVNYCHASQDQACISRLHTRHIPPKQDIPQLTLLHCALLDFVYATFRSLLGHLICFLRRERVCYFLYRGRQELRSGDRKGERNGERAGALGQRYIYKHARGNSTLT